VHRSDKFRIKKLPAHAAQQPSGYGWMPGTVAVLDEIDGPAWIEPWDAQLGIAYRGENGPVYWVNNEEKETDTQ
jgi:hypothetical protein